MVTLGTNTEDHSQIWQFTRVPFPLLSLSQQTKELFGRQTQILQESPWRDWWVKHPLCVKHSLMGDSGPSRLWLCSTVPMLSFLYHTSCSPCCGWNYLGASCLHEHLHSVPVSWLSTLLPQFHVQHLRVATVVHRELCSWFQLSRDLPGVSWENQVEEGWDLHVKGKTWSIPNLCRYIQALKLPRCLTEVNVDSSSSKLITLG